MSIGAARTNAWVVYDVLCRTVGKRSRSGARRLHARAGDGNRMRRHASLCGTRRLRRWDRCSGTIMAANVLFVIIPRAPRGRSRAEEADAPRRPHRKRAASSVRCTATTSPLPVLFAMLSNHFSVHGRACPQLADPRLPDGDRRLDPPLLQFPPPRPSASGGSPSPAALALVGIAVWLRPTSSAASSAPVPFVKAGAIVAQRCAACPSLHPTAAGFSAPPKGIVFDTPQEIQARAQLVLQQAVVQRTMPLGNTTHMTPAERCTLGAWIRQGAKIR